MLQNRRLCLLFKTLFCFLAEDGRENAAEEYACSIWNGGQKRHFRRCALAGVFDAAEHITVIVCHYDAHEVRNDESENGEENTQFFHVAVSLIHLLQTN